MELDSINWQNLCEGKAHSSVIIRYFIVQRTVTMAYDPTYCVHAIRRHQYFNTKQHCKMKPYKLPYSRVVCIGNQQMVIVSQPATVGKLPLNRARNTSVTLTPLFWIRMKTNVTHRNLNYIHYYCTNNPGLSKVSCERCMYSI